MVDVAVIGAGVVGCCIARELSRYKLNILVLEKGNDVATGATRANSGIVHAGFDAKPGTNKAKFNVLGCEIYDRWHKDLQFHFYRNTAYVLCFEESEKGGVEELYKKGVANGVKGLEIHDRATILKNEPHVSEKVVSALYAPTSGIVCPYDFAIAAGTNAAQNGVKFEFNKRVTNVVKERNGFTITTDDNSTYTASVIVNAAGVFSDIINNLLSKRKIHMHVRRGEYYMLDRTTAYITGRTLFQLPSKMGKGILVSNTVDGNIIVGPSAEDTDDREDVSTKREILEMVAERARVTVPNLPLRDTITQFTGLRAHCDAEDFVLGEPEDVPGLFNAVGVESPGLTSSPAIAEFLAKSIAEKLNAGVNPSFNPVRPPIKRFSAATNEERNALIKANPLYGRVICRCETVTEAEITESLHTALPARDLDGVKRRTRAQMGRCQGGFCSPNITQIIARELKVPLKSVSKFGPGTEIITGDLKEGL